MSEREVTVGEREANGAEAEEMVARWIELIREHEEEQPTIPLRTLLGEGIDLAAMIEAHFHPRELKNRRFPGLVAVSGQGQLTESTAREIRELCDVIARVHSRATLAVEGLDHGVIERGEFLELELRAALSYVLEDGSRERGAQQRARLRAEHKPIVTHDGLALALDGYASLAQEHRELLEGIGFELELITEARSVARALRERSAQRLAGRMEEEQRDLLSLRNRLTAALLERIRAARRAFRYVFRDHPDIVRKIGSEYERARRRVYRENAALSDSSDDTVLGMPTPVVPVPTVSTPVVPVPTVSTPAGSAPAAAAAPTASPGTAPAASSPSAGRAGR